MAEMQYGRFLVAAAAFGALAACDRGAARAPEWRDGAADAMAPFEAGTETGGHPAVEAGTEAGLTGAADGGAPTDAGADGLPGAQDAGEVDASDATGMDAEAGQAPSPSSPPAPVGCIEDVSAGVRTVPCDGIDHELSVPEECLERACGLILDIHGGAMTAAHEEKNTELASLGRERGYIVVQPNAPPHEELGLSPQWLPAQDDARVLAFAQDVQAAFRVDPDRVHMTGMSLGSFMTSRFACAHADWLASVAPASGAYGQPLDGSEPGKDCLFTADDGPSRELPILMVHGTRDTVSPFVEAVDKRDRIRELFEMDEGEAVDGDGAFTRTRYENPRGVVFEFIEHDYAVALEPWAWAGWELSGHCFVGSQDQMPTPGEIAPLGCAPPNGFHWGREVIAFFEAHPRR